jgi:hypothetical protein
METNQVQEELLQDAMAEAVAYVIHKQPILEMVLAKISDTPELDNLNAELLANAFDCIVVDVGTLMSAHMKSGQRQSMEHINQGLVRRRVDRIDEHGR